MCRNELCLCNPVELNRVSLIYVCVCEDFAYFNSRFKTFLGRWQLLLYRFHERNVNWHHSLGGTIEMGILNWKVFGCTLMFNFHHLKFCKSLKLSDVISTSVSESSPTKIRYWCHVEDQCNDHNHRKSQGDVEIVTPQPPPAAKKCSLSMN